MPDIIKWYLNYLYFFLYGLILFDENNLEYLISNSDKIIATSKGMLKWAKTKGNVKKGKFIYISHNIPKIKYKKKLNKNKIYLAHVGVIGSSNYSKEFLEYFLKLPANIKNKFDITFAGYGDLYHELKINIKKIIFILLVGKIKKEKFYRKSNFGMVLYKNRQDFKNNIVNKVSEYLAIAFQS